MLAYKILKKCAPYSLLFDTYLYNLLLSILIWLIFLSDRTLIFVYLRRKSINLVLKTENSVTLPAYLNPTRLDKYEKVAPCSLI